MSEKIEIELAERVANLEAHAFRTDETLRDLDSWLARVDEKYDELSQAVGRLEPATVEVPQAVREFVKEAEPAKRREWWVVISNGPLGEFVRSFFECEAEANEFALKIHARQVVRVIEAPTETEIEAAYAAMARQCGTYPADRMVEIIRKLLGGGE